MLYAELDEKRQRERKKRLSEKTERHKIAAQNREEDEAKEAERFAKETSKKNEKKKE